MGSICIFWVFRCVFIFGYGAMFCVEIKNLGVEYVNIEKNNSEGKNEGLHSFEFLQIRIFL